MGLFGRGLAAKREFLVGALDDNHFSVSVGAR